MTRRKDEYLPVSPGLFFQHICATAHLAKDQFKELELAAKDQIYPTTSMPFISYTLIATLSIELLLKYHYFLKYGYAPAHHRSLKIYKALDSHIQISLKEHFDPRIKRHPGSIIEIEYGQSNKSTVGSPPNLGEMRIEKVLKHSEKMFTYYRFIAERNLDEPSSAKVVHVGALSFMVELLSQSVFAQSGQSPHPSFKLNSVAKQTNDKSEMLKYFKNHHVDMVNSDGSSAFDAPYLAIVGGGQMSHPAKKLLRQHLGLSGTNLSLWMTNNAAEIVVAGWCVCVGIELMLKGMLKRDKTPYKEDHSLTKLFVLLQESDRERSEFILNNIFISINMKQHRLMLKTSMDKEETIHTPKLDTVTSILAELDAHYLSLRYSYEVKSDYRDNRKFVYLQHSCFVSDALTMTAYKYTNESISKIYS